MNKFEAESNAFVCLVNVARRGELSTWALLYHVTDITNRDELECCCLKAEALWLSR